MTIASCTALAESLGFGSLRSHGERVNPCRMMANVPTVLAAATSGMRIVAVRTAAGSRLAKPTQLCHFWQESRAERQSYAQSTRCFARSRGHRPP